jgi:hypothetical protein
VSDNTGQRAPEDLPIVLVGGPADGHWYHRADFEQRQRAARRMAEIHHRRALDPASWPLSYRATTTVVAHRHDPNRQAVQWIWTGPADARTLHDLARLDAAAAAGRTVA